MSQTQLCVQRSQLWLIGTSDQSEDAPSSMSRRSSSDCTNTEHQSTATPSAKTAAMSLELRASVLSCAPQNEKYTINDLRKAIPPHCFRPSTIRSAAYILRDLLYASILFYIASHISSIRTSCLRKLAWTVYGFCQGLVFTGLWNLAHECGHGALSKHKWFNHGVGLVLHSCLLTPYHSWRYTHQTHHKKTNNLDGDIGFIPPTLEQHNAQPRPPIAKLPWYDLVEDTPIATLLFLIFYQLLAWPCYLILNNFSLDRVRCFKWWKRSHLYLGGDGPSFAPRHFRGVLISGAAIAVVILMLSAASQRFGGQNVLLYWGIPYLWTNHWMIIITYLQHIDPRLPYYTQSNFTFLRGAASTIDRDIGFVGRHLWHGTINYHVLHHHFSTIPSYHAREASEAMQKVMGDAYISDVETNWLAAFWRYQNACRFVTAQKVEGVKGQVYYYPMKKDKHT